MKVKAGEWLALKPVERYLEIHRAYVKTQKNNPRSNVSYESNPISKPNYILT